RPEDFPPALTEYVGQPEGLGGYEGLIPRDLSTTAPSHGAGTLQAPELSFVDQLTAALLAERGNVTRVSKVLNIPKRTLYRKIQKYEIDLEKYR
ncbi:MAG: helix-turn-helix domain-containing protein, partial [Anaerovoracaceae bacterium]